MRMGQGAVTGTLRCAAAGSINAGLQGAMALQHGAACMHAHPTVRQQHVVPPLQYLNSTSLQVSVLIVLTAHYSSFPLAQAA